MKKKSIAFHHSVLQIAQLLIQDSKTFTQVGLNGLVCTEWKVIPPWIQYLMTHDKSDLSDFITHLTTYLKEKNKCDILNH